MLNKVKNKKTFYIIIITKVLRIISFYIGIIYFRVFLRGTIIGKENLPAKGCFLAFNHVSYLDWMLVYTLFRFQYGLNVYFVGDLSLLRTLIFRIWIYNTGTIDINPKSFSSIKKAYKKMRAHLRNGDFVGIFPEGERSPTGKLLKAKDGIAQMLFDTNVPVVPIGLTGFYEAWPPHKKFPGIARCEIKIGKPLRFRTEDYRNKNQLVNIIINTIMHEIAYLTGDTYDHAPPIRKRSDDHRGVRANECRRQAAGGERVSIKKSVSSC